jgi:radical SAM superfamily enzyme YgiQ (UPF0313 family)
LEEMLFLEQRYRDWMLQEFYFFDPSFLSPGAWRTTFLNGLGSIGRFTWGCEARVDEVDEPLLRLAQSAGCRYINFGVESARDDMLNRLTKGITVDETVDVFYACHRLGIRPGALLMLGLPGETAEDVREMKLLLKKIRPTFVNLSIAAPYPGTELTRTNQDRIRRLSPYEFGDYYPERTLFTDLSIDPVLARQEIAAFYRSEVDPQGIINPQ